jgi:hypothetical protein
MNVGEKLHEIGLEHPDRFVFMGDVTLRHTPYHAPFPGAINAGNLVLHFSSSSFSSSLP